MATALEQSAESNGGKSGTLAVTLSSAPSSGRILVVGACEDTGVSINSITNSMTLAGSITQVGVTTWLYYKETDGTESATTTITFSSGCAAWAWAAEFSGVDTYQSAVTNSSRSSSATAGTDGDGSTTLDVAMFGADGNLTFSSPTPSGFAIDDQGTGGPSYAATWDGDRGDANNPGVTLSSSVDWAAVHATFETPSSVPGGAMVHHLKMMGM